MTDVIVIRPMSDAVEGTLSLWADLLLPPGTGRPGVRVVQDLAGPAATPATALAACGAAAVLLFFGHGTERTLGIPTLLDVGSFSTASGQVVIAIACLSGAELGPQAVARNGVAAYLGFSEPLFVYNAHPALFGFQLAYRISDYLTGMSTLAQTKDHVEQDFKAIEQLYHFGAPAGHPDALMIWMGARMNWRGLALA